MHTALSGTLPSNVVQGGAGCRPLSVRPLPLLSSAQVVWVQLCCAGGTPSTTLQPTGTTGCV